jgi:hypothetical protein
VAPMVVVWLNAGAISAVFAMVLHCAGVVAAAAMTDMMARQNGDFCFWSGKGNGDAFW